MPLLDYNTERQSIKDAIDTSKKCVKFKQVLGTMENFKEVVSLKPQILHIICHGDYNKVTNQGELLFEQENGEGIYTN